MINIKIPSAFSTGPIILRRYSPGSYVDGIWVDGTLTDTPLIGASVQPLEPSEYRLLPEGDSGSKAYKIFWNGAFQIGIEGSVKADEVIIDGVLYRMSRPENWNGFGYTAASFVEANP